MALGHWPIGGDQSTRREASAVALLWWRLLTSSTYRTGQGGECTPRLRTFVSVFTGPGVKPQAGTIYCPLPPRRSLIYSCRRLSLTSLAIKPGAALVQESNQPSSQTRYLAMLPDNLYSCLISASKCSPTAERQMKGPPPDSERCGITGEQIKMGGLFPSTSLTTSAHSALTRLL